MAVLFLPNITGEKKKKNVTPTPTHASKGQVSSPDFYLSTAVMRHLNIPY